MLIQKKNSNKMSLTIVGTVAYDGIETPFGKRERILGGAAMYAALSASYLVKSPRIISVVGNDFEAEDKELLERHTVDLEGIETIEDGKCFFWKGYYHENMNQRDTLVTDLNVLADFDPKVPAAYQDTEFLLLGNLTPAVQAAVLDRLEKRPKVVVLDTMNFWMDIALEELHAVIKRIDVLTINDEEARQLSGEYSLVTAADKILKMGPKYLIIKKGEHGALLFGEGKMFFSPALPLAEVIDPTGAGDSFAGGFIGYLAAQNEVNFETMKTAVVYGSIMGSFNVQKFGPEALIDLPASAVKERLQQFVELSQFKY